MKRTVRQTVRKHGQGEGGADNMRWLKKLHISLLLLSVMVMTIGQTAFAEEAAGSASEGGYTYTVKVYGGNPKIGKSTGGGVAVEAGSGADVSSDGKCVTVSGLKYGDRVYINAQDAANVVDGKYYVKGVRKAGREDSEASEGSFEVDGDRDFVISYGIKGSMVAYTVNYLDAAGNTLLPSDTYYGNPGERQYVSSRYVDGYVPQAMNLVKTLSANEAENVFDFQYTPVAPGTVTTPPAADAGTAAPAADAGAAAPAADAGAAAAPAPAGEDLVAAPDEETPQDLVDLDEEGDEVPLANVKADRPGTVMSYTPVYVGIGAAAVAALALMAFYLKKRRKAPVSEAEEFISEMTDDER